MDQGVFRYRRPPKPSKTRILERQKKREQHREADYNELWRTLPAGAEAPTPPSLDPDEQDIGEDVKLPEENILDAELYRTWSEARNVKRVVIVNGLKPGQLTKALAGENVGTVITKGAAS